MTTRLALLGTPAARPLDFVDAFLGSDLSASSAESEESGRFRVFVVTVPFQGGVLRLDVAIAPRSGVEEAFAAALAGADAALVLSAAGRRVEQDAALSAAEVALRAGPPRPVVHVVNEFVPPRVGEEALADATAPDRFGAVAVVRGRYCWWRHEKTGTDVARSAVAAALRAISGRGPAAGA